MIPDGLAADITLGSWPVLPIFDVLERAGDIDHKEMYNIFNMGIGMVLASPPNAPTRRSPCSRTTAKPDMRSARSSPTPTARRSR